MPDFSGEVVGLSDGSTHGAASTVASEPPAISVEVPVVADAEVPATQKATPTP